ncbi:uncharacterized protein LOC107616254 [Arachis ipaensis]|uniref:Uncharacterized protein n=1 Tax=Arachis hypogaea TaxID=3818 RepID=A0A6B9VF53_ARAHY|nr:uncharacterized protein LOC107616254 [Arachis ipaensis]XP_029151649.1 uncharacterized protein LOC114925983 [Arachis hypogaea]QHN79311.1 uncharacterized protein DS421_19g668990 [Arachis hypogaea]
MVRILHTWKKNNDLVPTHETQSPASPSFIFEDDVSKFVFQMEAPQEATTSTDTEDEEGLKSIERKQSESLEVNEEDDEAHKLKEMDDQQLRQIKGKKKMVTYDIDKLQMYSEDEFLNKHYEKTSYFPCRLQPEEDTLDILTMIVKEKRGMIRSTRKMLKQMGRELKNSEDRLSTVEKKLRKSKCSSSTSSSLMS